MRKNLLALKLEKNLQLVAQFRDSVADALQCLEGIGVAMPPLPVQVNTGLLAAKEAGEAREAAEAAEAAADAAAALPDAPPNVTDSTEPPATAAAAAATSGQ